MDAPKLDILVPNIRYFKTDSSEVRESEYMYSDIDCIVVNVQA